MGEAYLRNVDYASNNIIQSVEQMGAEIRMPAIMEVLWYSLYKQRYFQELGRHRVKAFIHRVQHGILNRIERKMRPPMRPPCFPIRMKSPSGRSSGRAA